MSEPTATPGNLAAVGPFTISPTAPVTIPYPFQSPAQVTYVVILNASPFTIVVSQGQTLGQAAPFSQDAYMLKQPGVPITCVALAGVGVANIASADASVYATFSENIPPGTYPAPHGGALVQSSAPFPIVGLPTTFGQVTLPNGYFSAPIDTRGFLAVQTPGVAPLAAGDWLDLAWYATEATAANANGGGGALRQDGMLGAQRVGGSIGLLTVGGAIPIYARNLGPWLVIHANAPSGNPVWLGFGGVGAAIVLTNLDLPGPICSPNALPGGSAPSAIDQQDVLGIYTAAAAGSVQLRPFCGPARVIYYNNPWSAAGAVITISDADTASAYGRSPVIPTGFQTGQFDVWLPPRPCRLELYNLGAAGGNPQIVVQAIRGAITR